MVPMLMFIVQCCFCTEKNCEPLGGTLLIAHRRCLSVCLSVCFLLPLTKNDRSAGRCFRPIVEVKRIKLKVMRSQKLKYTMGMILGHAVPVILFCGEIKEAKFEATMP